MQFGDFIKSKRLAAEITLRDMSERIKVSPAYLSDIENNRRYPMDNEKMAVLIKELNLTTEEAETVYDLAGKARNELSPDLLEYTMDSNISPYVRTALRKAKKAEATVEDWKEFIKKLDGKE